MDGRRLLLVMLCVFLIMSVHSYYNSKLNPRKDSTAGSSSPSSSNGGASSASGNGAQPSGSGAGNGAGANNTGRDNTGDGSGDAAVVAPQVELEQFPIVDHRLQNDLLSIELTSVGASVDRVELLQHFLEDHTTPLPLFGDELESGRAFTIALTNRALERGPIPLEDLSWRKLPGDTPREVRFAYPLPDGDEVVKVFRLGDGYLLNIEVQWPNELGPVAAGAEPCYELRGPDRIRHDRVSMAPANQCVTAVAGPQGKLAKVERLATGEIERGERKENFTPLWSALTSNYFAFVIRPDEALTNSKAPWELWYRQSNAATRIEDAHKRGLQEYVYQIAFQRRLAGQQSHFFEVFMGPKERALLNNYSEQGYNELIDYGWFGIFIRLFLTLITLFESLVGNYGVAIIMLTVLVKLVLHPLNKRNQSVMQRNQKKMAKIQPKMKEIKERYKNDALKANKEIQKLMAENGVNPAQMFGGCLMMFLQLPIWIGLYRTCSLAIELRQQPFLYISDLTEPDRLFSLGFTLPWGWDSFNLLPLLYVVLTVINQSMMPKSDDPNMQQQQKMMKFMMIAFGFIFYNFSSGLLLYFLTNSGLGILEQRIIRAELKREEEAETATGATP